MRLFKYSFIVILLPFLWLFALEKQPIDTTVAYKPPFEYSDDSLHVDLLRYKSGDRYVLNDTIDLRGKSWYLPPYVELEVRGGIIKNGNIVGNYTKLIYTGTVFSRVHIKGFWNIPTIHSSMFADLDYDNSLKDVFALANPAIKNSIIIDPGTYHVTAIKPSDRCLVVKDNTDVTINGDIVLTPNAYENYNIFRLYGDNITVSGSGSIRGDKFTHLGDKGEWGMGFEIIGGRNIQVKDLSICDCWGDCIYIAGKAKKVLIENCRLDYGRRQGISVCSADSVFIRYCTITNIGGTAPESAIDVEPNDNEMINYVLIDGVQISQCVRGIMSYREMNNTTINTVIVKNCSLDKIIKSAMGFTHTRNVMVSNNKIGQYGGEKAIRTNGVGTITFERNSIKGRRLKNNKKGYSYLNITGDTKIVIK